MISRSERWAAAAAWAVCTCTIAIAAIPLGARPVWAQPQTPPAGQQQVVEVEIVGLRRVEREAALQGVRTRPGAPFDPATVTEDIRALWRTGFFRDIRALREDTVGGVRVIFEVVEKPSIREVRIAGNDDLSNDDITAVIDIRPFTILNVENLERNVQKIKDLYVEKGYFLADVKHRTLPVPQSEHEVDVVFDIVENAKVMVRQIAFVGNEKIRDDEIKGNLQTREGDELSFLTQSGTYKQEFFQTDLFRIQAIYYDRGFVAVKVGEPSATISKDRRFIYLSVPIEEGEIYQIGNIAFSGDVELRDEEGNVIIDEQGLRNRLLIAPGDTFNRTDLFQDIQAVTDAYRDQGYAYANVTPNSALRTEDREVDLDLEIERGDVVTIERIEIAGNTKTRDKVIRREMRIHEGERYSASKINESRARIFQLGYFETVNVNTGRGTEPDTMVVTVEIKEKSTGTFQIGAGFSSVESFIATAQIAQNNFLGNGWLLSVSAQLSFGDFARQLATLQFYEPYLFDTDISFGLNAYITQRYYRDFQRNATGISPSFGYPITHDLRVSFGYTIEQIDISSDFAGSPGGIAYYGLNRNRLNSTFHASVSYDTRDNRLFPTAGMYHLLSGAFTWDPRPETDPEPFGRLELALRFYYPLPFDFVFKTNLSGGWVFGGGPNGVPISERFFPGGIFSVRGFEPRGLGPTIRTLPTGDPSGRTTEFTIGGNKEVVLNLEVEFPIIEVAGIKGVVFFDAGNAYNDDQNFFYVDTADALKPSAYLWRDTVPIPGGPPLGLYYSFGFGFRWFSPIGPLRFEWGIPITKRDPGDRDIIFEFTIGNFF